MANRYEFMVSAYHRGYCDATKKAEEGLQKLLHEERKKAYNEGYLRGRGEVMSHIRGILDDE